MSVISLTFDTESKSMSVSLDGNQLENVKYACFYNSYDNRGFSAEVGILEVDQKDMQKHSTIRASQ